MRLGFFWLLVAALIIAGCSGGNSVTTPDQASDSLNTVPIIGLTAANDTFDAIGMLGAYELSINPDKMTADLVSKRLPAIGEDYVVSGLGFFTVAPCSDCVKLASISFVGGNLTLTFDIRHPFAPGNPANPPSAINRLDLDVFDVAAIVAPLGGTPTPYALTGKSIFTNVLGNADGYTTELSSVISGQTAALPFVLVVDDTVGGTSTFNKFGMGATGSFDLTFNVAAGTSLNFDMYLTMGYGASAKKAQRLTPSYYNPEFNRKAAWKVVVTPPEGTNPPAIGNTWQDNDATTTYDVKVEVYDWQKGATVDATLADQSSIFAASDPASVSVEIPGMNSTLPSVTADDGTGTGMPGSPLVFNVPVANANLLAAGKYMGLVKVLDARAPLTPADGRDFIIHTPDGVALNNYTMPEYATYQLFTATVVVGCGPITGDIESPACPVTGVSTGAKIDFTVLADSANGGNPIALYEADLDYDGTTFDADMSNTTGAFLQAGPFDNPNCPNPTPVTYTVAFRATDSCTPPNVTIFATCDVTVSLCATYQELTNNFDSCTTPVLTCQNWTAGGCSLPNSDNYSWSHFGWGCPHGGSVACVSGGYITSGGDSTGCSYLSDTAPNCNLNVVSPQMNLPSATDSFFEIDHCNSFVSTGVLTAYVRTSTPCNTTGWTSLGTAPAGAGCHTNTTWSLAAYSGTTVRVRLCYTTGSEFGGSGTCGTNAGVIIDNPRIGGTFAGTLAWN